MGQHIAHTFDLNTYHTPEAVDALFEEESHRQTDAMRDHMTSDPHWFGCESSQELASVIARGDSKSTDLVKQAHRECAALTLPKARSVKPVWQTARYAGTRLNVDRALQGMPDAWGRFERSKQVAGTQRTIALYVPLSGNCNLSAREIAWSPVAALVCADILEGAGYRCEIWGIEQTISMHARGYSITCRFAVKQAEDTLDLNSIARLAHPSVLRGICFATNTVELFKQAGVELGSGHGNCSGESIDPKIFGEENAIMPRPARDIRGCIAEINRVIKLFTSDEKE